QFGPVPPRSAAKDWVRIIRRAVVWHHRIRNRIRGRLVCGQRISGPLPDITSQIGLSPSGASSAHTGLSDLSDVRGVAVPIAQAIVEVVAPGEDALFVAAGRSVFPFSLRGQSPAIP